MIPYKLAKQLEETGLTLPKKKCREYVGSPDEKTIITLPTLSELIKECVKEMKKGGERFVLSNEYFGQEKEWGAGSLHFHYDDISWVGVGEGETPEEAVVKLFLKLRRNAKEK